MNKREKRKYITPFIMLIAGLITSIIDMINKVDVTQALIRLLVVLIIFYIIGAIARFVVGKIIDNMGGEDSPMIANIHQESDDKKMNNE